MNVDDSGLDYRKPILIIDLQNLIEPRELEDHRALKRQCATRKTGAGAARREWNVRFGEDLHRGSNFFSGAGYDYSRGNVLVDCECVGFVDEQLVGVGENVLY